MNPIATSVLVHSVCKSIAESSTRQIMFPRHTFSYRFPTYNLLFVSCPPCQLNFGFMILFIIPFNPILIDSLPSVPVHWVIIIMTGEHFASSGIFCFAMNGCLEPSSYSALFWWGTESLFRAIQWWWCQYWLFSVVHLHNWVDDFQDVKLTDELYLPSWRGFCWLSQSFISDVIAPLIDYTNLSILIIVRFIYSTFAAPTECPRVISFYGQTPSIGGCVVIAVVLSRRPGIGLQRFIDPVAIKRNSLHSVQFDE